MAQASAEVRELERRAAEVRLQIVKAMGPDTFHHFGGSLSVADLLVALYCRQMRYRAEEPEWPERDASTCDPARAEDLRRLLERRGHRRLSSQTPLEFARCVLAAEGRALLITDADLGRNMRSRLRRQGFDVTTASAR